VRSVKHITTFKLLSFKVVSLTLHTGGPSSTEAQKYVFHKNVKKDLLSKSEPASLA
jgi:hypothetical protein